VEESPQSHEAGAIIMAVNQRRRQKKLEQRKAKQKAERRMQAQRESRGISGWLEQAAGAPILHCGYMADLWQKGIGEVLLSRTLKNGKVAFAAFLVDVYCLGVKNAMFNIVSRGQYDDLCDRLRRRAPIVPIEPEAARKLVEGAVQYTGNMGLSPHPDYHTAKLIFGDISTEACTKEFTFGLNGKPCFIPGPYDGPARCEQVFHAIARHLGEDPNSGVPL
jgi:hypothetical protein